MLQYYVASYFNDLSKLCEIVQLRNITNVIKTIQSVPYGIFHNFKVVYVSTM